MDFIPLYLIHVLCVCMWGSFGNTLITCVNNSDNKVHIFVCVFPVTSTFQWCQEGKQLYVNTPTSNE